MAALQIDIMKIKQLVLLKSRKQSNRKPKRTWSRYVMRVLKRTNNGRGMTMSSKAMAIVNSFLNDVFDRVAVEAGSVARTNKVKTISSGAVQAAVRLSLPGDLGKHAVVEGTKAVAAAAKAE